MRVLAMVFANLCSMTSYSNVFMLTHRDRQSDLPVEKYFEKWCWTGGLAAMMFCATPRVLVINVIMQVTCQQCSWPDMLHYLPVTRSLQCIISLWLLLSTLHLEVYNKKNTTKTLYFFLIFLCSIIFFSNAFFFPFFVK